MSEDKKKKTVLKTKVKRRECIISIYFGPPGCGKTTAAALICKRFKKRGIPVYSNVWINGTFKCDPKTDWGVYDIFDAKLICDEASIEFNNRRFKQMPQTVIEFLKLHRHYCTSIDFFSQSWDDIDITIRRLAQKLYLIRKSIIPGFITLIPIKQRFGPSEDESEIIFKYKFARFPFWIWRFAPAAWKSFNTLDRPQLPVKDWGTW